MTPCGSQTGCSGNIEMLAASQYQGDHSATGPNRLSLFLLSGKERRRVDLLAVPWDWEGKVTSRCPLWGGKSKEPVSGLGLTGGCAPCEVPREIKRYLGML